MGQAELQRALAAVFKSTGLDQMCEGCGGLNRMSSCSIVVRGDAEPPTCSTCGVLLDANGNAAGHVGQDGRVWCRVIRLPGAS